MGGTVPMGARALTRALICLACLTMPALAEVPHGSEREALRQDWHACVRDAFSGQPASLDKRKAQRAALAQCKTSENALVAAELAAEQEAEAARRKGGLTSGLTTRARAWMSSVAGHVVDPVLAWIGR